MDEKPVVKVDEDIADLIPDYLDDQRNNVRFLKELLSQKDFKEIAKLAHKLKGSGASFGFEFLTNAGTSIENAAKKNNVRIISENIEKLNFFLERVIVNFVSEEDL